MLHPRKIIAPAIAGLATFGLAAAFALTTTSHPPQDNCVLEAEVGYDYGHWTVEEFPRTFEGAFLWDADTSDRNEQSVRYRIDDVQERGELLVATGRGVVSYTHFPREPEVSFDLRIEVNRNTGTFQMWESNPSREENYTVAGKYTAEIDVFEAPRESLTARWVGDDGKDGTLVLKKMSDSRSRATIE